jgi:CheY-like chemotaxis protein
VKTLLVLEDEPVLMVLLRHLLKPYNLIEAARLFAFLTRMAAASILLLADVTLPAGSGIQVALLLARRFRVCR